jgi:hypothetical protein
VMVAADNPETANLALQFTIKSETRVQVGSLCR